MSALAILLGLAVSGAYGVSDFLGGAASKRCPVLWVLLASQTAGLILVGAVVMIDQSSVPTLAALERGAIAGVLSVAGLAILYRALAGGPMGVVAPFAAVAGALVPVGWGLAKGERPGAAALAGIICALAGVALVSLGPGNTDGLRAPTPSRSILLGTMAGVCFGAILVLMANLPSATGLWPVLTWRVTALVLLTGALAVMRPGRVVTRPVLLLAGAAGMLESLGNSLYLVAARHGLVALVGLVSSLYPAVTVALAASVLRERLGQARVAGLALAVIGIGLVAAG